MGKVAPFVTGRGLVGGGGEDAGGAGFGDELGAAAAQWHARGRPKGLLWRGDPLADYTRWRARHTGPLTDIEAAFAAASLADAARGRANRRILLGSGFAVLGLGVVGLVVANTRIDGQRARAQTASERAAASAREAHDRVVELRIEEGRQALLASDPMRAIVYFSAAASDGAHRDDLQFMIARAATELDAQQHVLRHSGPVRSFDFAPDGSLVATADVDAARVWQVASGQPLETLRSGGVVQSVQFSPDGTLLVAGGEDKA